MNEKYDTYAVMDKGDGTKQLIPVRSVSRYVPISQAGRLARVSVQTIHNYIKCDFLKKVRRPTPFKWLIDIDEFTALLEQTVDPEFWTPARTAAYLKAKRSNKGGTVPKGKKK